MRRRRRKKKETSKEKSQCAIWYSGKNEERSVLFSLFGKGKCERGQR